MTSFTQIRAGLISSVLLLTTALASPAFAYTLPEISPRQIANDVEIVQNPETGAQEYVARSFDPFEEDSSMAGTASLRSVSNATAIDGQSVRGGALLDMTFYYNSASNDPYDTRGFDDAVFLSGDYAPVTRRDNRILECNENVQAVVYYHDDYYRPSLYGNLYRPYRYYSGHFLFNTGFGSGRGYNYGRAYSGSRGFGTTSRSRNRILNTRRNSRDNSRGGFIDRLRGTDREDRTDNRRRVNRDTTRTRTDEERRNARNNRRNGEDSRSDRREEGEAATRLLETGDSSRSNRRTTRRNGQTTNRAVPQTARTATSRSTPRSDANVAAARSQRAENNARAAEKSKNTPKRNSGSKDRSQTRNRNSQSKNSQSKSRSQTRSRNSGSTRSRIRNKLKLMSFLPMASAFSRNVVRNVDIQCAREETLSLHIPQERLEAARFDGLTVLVLDRAGQEIPVFVPPNYIEGFRQAVTGRAVPNVSYQEPRSSAPVTSGPVTRGPVYQQTRPTIQSAPCPVGTTKQSDGTCLQGGTTSYGGYPAR